MFSTRDMPSPSSMFTAYASMTASVMLFRSMANDLIPQPVRNYLLNTLRYFIKPHSSILTLVIEESVGIARNEVYDAAEVYLSTRVSHDNERLKIFKSPKEKKLTVRLEKGEKVDDFYQGAELKWRFICAESENRNSNPNEYPIAIRSEKKYFELSFHKKHKEMVLENYLPFILEKAKEMKDEERVLKMHTLNTSYCSSGGRWDSINLEHPSTFKTLAMEPELKEAVIEDLNRFVKRKEFYQGVGRAWKRGYLLYGPPGTGKSSLIAAMANHLKFDIYDLQLADIMRDSDLRKLLLATANRSILVIEDIDCSVDLPERRHGDGRKQADVQVTLSGLLNFIDGLWSSCGDERIIVFTTNHKEKLDPALLRPGRMDVHIHMSYCSPSGFKQLASTYLGIKEHSLFGDIEEAIQATKVTPADVAEQLLKNDDIEVALRDLIDFLAKKKIENEQREAKKKEAEAKELEDKKKEAESKEKEKQKADGDKERKTEKEVDNDDKVVVNGLNNNNRHLKV